jgi:hypothetical protein
MRGKNCECIVLSSVTKFMLSLNKISKRIQKTKVIVGRNREQVHSSTSPTNMSAHVHAKQVDVDL